MPTISSTTAVALAALTLSLAACGGGGDDGSLDKGDLQSKANAICKDVESKLKAVKQPSNIQDPAAASKYFDAVVPLATELDDKLKALEPADDVKTDYDAFTAASGKVTALLTSVRDKAKAKDASGLQDLAKLQPLTDAADAAAKKLDIAACAG